MTESLGGHGAAHHALLWGAVVAAFAVSCLGLLLLYRRISSRVELERAEAVLAAGLERPDQPVADNSDPPAILPM